MTDAPSLAGQLERAHQRLRDKGLLGDANDAVSVRLPGTGLMLYRAHRDEAPRELAIGGAEGFAELHARAYRLRADAGAIASVSTRSSAALSAPGGHVPPVFDEQARHIGDAWPSAPSSALSEALGTGANAGAIDGRWLVLGVTPSRMVFNAELFEKSSRAYLLARGDGRRIHRVPWWVCWIAGRRLRRDQRNAARHHEAGRPSPELIAY